MKIYLALVGTAKRTRRAANRKQIDVEIFDLGADRVIEEVLDADACRPAERRRRKVEKAGGTCAETPTADCAAGGSIKEEVGPSIASTESKGAQPMNIGLAGCAGP